MIILILILFSGVDILNGNETPDIDIFRILKSNNITCNLHDFVNSDDDYKLLIQDLTNYCSNSQSYQLLCHMIFLELEIACLLPNNSRPSSTKYTLDNRSKQICLINKISLANDWIWGKLSSNEKQQVGSSPTYLCLKITSSNETLRLVKFFYKIALRIRRYDSINTTSLNNKTYSIIQTPSSEKKNNTENKKIPEVYNQTIPDTRNKTKEIFVLSTNRTYNESKEKTKIEPTLDIHIQQQGKIVEFNVDNNKKKNEGSPFGRGRNDQERQQIDERPKPKVLDVESVFKLDKEDERNWVEGKNFGQGGNLPRIKLDENPLYKAQLARRRSPYKMKLNPHFDDDDLSHNDGDTSKNFITPILVFILCIVLLYLILHNKNKVLGLIIEGCKRRPTSSNRRTHITSRIRLSQSTYP